MEFLGHKSGISVVISTYNRPFYVVNLIRQLMAQVGLSRPVEVLVVSDGGRRGSLEVIRQLTMGSKWPVRFYDSMQKDAYALALCRNIGIRFARYDRLVFLDDDVSIGRDFLSKYAEMPEGLCLGRINCIVERDEAYEVMPDLRCRILKGPTRRLDPWKPWLGYLWGGNFSVPTRFAMAVGGFDLAFIDEGQEDTDFGARLMYFMSGAYVVPSAVAIHFGPLTNLAVSGMRVERRQSLARERFRRRGSLMVNRGLIYWRSAQWDQFCRNGPGGVRVEVGEVVF